MTGWLVNDYLTCIPGTKTLWHDLLEWLPDLQDRTGIPYYALPQEIERRAVEHGSPDYIIRNASWFRPMYVQNTKTISLVQDQLGGAAGRIQRTVCDASAHVVFNSWTMQEQFKGLQVPSSIIHIGTDHNLFSPATEDMESFRQSMGILPNSVVFIGAATHYPKGWHVLQEIVRNTSYNFCLIMKDGTVWDHPRVRVFNRVPHTTLVNILRSCSVALCTSMIETLHLAGIEAALCGLPVVTTPVGIYINQDSTDWGAVCGHDATSLIAGLDRVMAVRHTLHPREAFMKLDVTREQCRDKWRALIREVVG